jgi:hypothetical protein
MTPSPVDTVEAALDFAERIVRKGFGTPEQAAEMCGVALADLQLRLAQQPHGG